MSRSSGSFLRSIGGYRPAIAWVSVVGSCVAIVAATGQVIHSASFGEDPDFLDRTSLVSLSLMSICAVFAFVTQRKRHFRTALAIRSLLLIEWIWIGRGDSSLDTALLATLLFEIAIYEPFYLNLIFSSIMVTLIATVGAFTGPAAGTYARLGMVVLCELFALATCLSIHYRERVLELLGQVQRLDGAVGRLSSANLGFQEHASAIEQNTMIEERNRITREVHDTIGYTLTTTMMMLEAASDMVKRDPESAIELMGAAKENSRAGLDEVRHALHVMRAQQLPELDCAEIIQRLVTNFQAATNVGVQVSFGNLPRRLPAAIEAVLFHLTREGLTNAFRHSKASKIDIVLWIDDARTLTLDIGNDGFGRSAYHEGIGISGMRERVTSVGGHLSVSSVYDRFTVTAAIPLPDRPAYTEML